MPDLIIHMDEKQYENTDFVDALCDTGAFVICEEPGPTPIIDLGGCWPRAEKSHGTKHLTVHLIVHYKADPKTGKAIDGRTAEWEAAVVKKLSPTLGAVVERYYPGESISVSVDSFRMPFGPTNSFDDGAKRNKA